MSTYKLFLTRATGDKLLDVHQGPELPHVGDRIRLEGIGAVVTSVNAGHFVDQERGPLDGVVYATEGIADQIDPAEEVPNAVPADALEQS